MEQLKKHAKKHAQKLKFAIVGAANTALDFALFLLLFNLGVDKIASNYVSTSVAFIFSFFVNKSFTFKNKGGNVKKQFIAFIAVTAVALWVIQPLIIAGITAVIGTNNVTLIIAKLVATVASLIWNYVMYSRFVFKDKKETN